MLSQKPVHLHRVKFSRCWKTHTSNSRYWARYQLGEAKCTREQSHRSAKEDKLHGGCTTVWFLCIRIGERVSGCCAGGSYLWNLLRCFRLCYKTLNHRRSTLSDCAGFQCNACVQKRPTEGVGRGWRQILRWLWKGATWGVLVTQNRDNPRRSYERDEHHYRFLLAHWFWWTCRFLRKTFSWDPFIFSCRTISSIFFNDRILQNDT